LKNETRQIIKKGQVLNYQSLLPSLPGYYFALDSIEIEAAKTLMPIMRLTKSLKRITLLYMKNSVLTIRLDDDLESLLTKASRQSGKNRSEIAREALRRQLRITQFESLRKRIMPFAEARGFLTDDDVFSRVS